MASGRSLADLSYGVVVWTLDRGTCDILNVADVPFSELG